MKIKEVTACVKHILIIVFLLSTFQTNARLKIFQLRQEQSADEIKQAENLIREAILKEDTIYLSNHICDDFIFVHSTGAVENKNQYIDNAKNGRLMVQRSDIDLLTHEVKGINSNIGLVLKKSRFFNKRDSTETFLRNLGVYIKTERKWCWLSGQSTKLPNRPKLKWKGEIPYKEYTGNYRINEKREFLIVSEGDKLFIKGLMNILPQDELIAQSSTEFIRFNEENDYGDSKIIFRPNSTGKIVSAICLIDGKQIWVAEKVK